MRKFKISKINKTSIEMILLVLLTSCLLWLNYDSGNASEEFFDIKSGDIYFDNIEPAKKILAIDAVDFNYVHSKVQVNATGDSTNLFIVKQTNNNNYTNFTGITWLWDCPNGCPFYGVTNLETGDPIPFEKKFSNGVLEITIEFSQPVGPGESITYTQSATATEKGTNEENRNWNLKWRIITNQNTDIKQTFFFPDDFIIDENTTEPKPFDINGSSISFNFQNVSQLLADINYTIPECKALSCVGNILDIPVPYHYDEFDGNGKQITYWNPDTGGNPANALLGYCRYDQNNSNCLRGSGLVTAWFDHHSPNYVVDNILVLWDGSQHANPPSTLDKFNCPTSFSCYDGHSGVDFQRRKYSKPYDSIYMSASGTIWAICDYNKRYFQNSQNNPKCVKSNLYGTYVIVQHDDYPCLATMYAHLDSVDEEIVEGRFYISDDENRQRIGEMGGTGGTPVHLHFATYWDCAEEPKWDENTAIDPYGYRGDINQVDSNFINNSTFLWRHGIPQKIEIGTGINFVQDDAVSLQIPVGVFNTGDKVTLYRSLLASQIPTSLSDIGLSFTIEVKPININSHTLMTSERGAYPKIGINYQFHDVNHIWREEELSIYRWNEDQLIWQKINSIVDTENKIITASVTELGKFSVLGPSKFDIFLPIASSE